MQVKGQRGRFFKFNPSNSYDIFMISNTARQLGYLSLSMSYLNGLFLLNRYFMNLYIVILSDLLNGLLKALIQIKMNIIVKSELSPNTRGFPYIPDFKNCYIGRLRFRIIRFLVFFWNKQVMRIRIDRMRIRIHKI